MKAEDLRKKSKEELEQSCLELNKELFVFRMRRSGGHETKTHLISIIKRNLARVKTILREKEGSLA